MQLVLSYNFYYWTTKGRVGYSLLGLWCESLVFWERKCESFSWLGLKEQREQMGSCKQSEKSDEERFTLVLSIKGEIMVKRTNLKRITLFHKKNNGSRYSLLKDNILSCALYKKSNWSESLPLLFKSCKEQQEWFAPITTNGAKGRIPNPDKRALGENRPASPIPTVLSVTSVTLRHFKLNILYCNNLESVSII